jgi:hypothetical protein
MMDDALEDMLDLDISAGSAPSSTSIASPPGTGSGVVHI